MAKSLFIIGSDTDVGKTMITAGLTYVLNNNNYNVCSYKPIQSGGIYYNNMLTAGDALFVKNMADLNEDIEKMNSYCLKEAISPHRAAEKEQVVLTKDSILSDYQALSNKYDYLLVEGAGGLIVPLIRNRYYIYNLIQDLEIPVILVTRTGIGTINHTCLTINYLKQLNIPIKAIVFNGYEGHDYEDDNINIIKEISGIDTTFVFPKLSEEYKIKELLQYEFIKSFPLQKILDLF
ncbi:dethiobiotin synthase [Vallitalea sediminicola]